MSWDAWRHELAPSLIGAEVQGLPTPSGEAGYTDHEVTARFDLFRATEPESTPWLTALWVSTVSRDDDTRSILRSVPEIDAALEGLGDDRVRIEPDPGDVVPDEGRHPLLLGMAREAVRLEVERLFPTGAESEIETWQTAPLADPTLGDDHPAAVPGDALLYTVWWGGVSDDVARTRPVLIVQPGSFAPVEVAGAEAFPAGDLVVRVVDDTEVQPRTIALALVRDGRADLGGLGLHRQHRVELVDSTLRPVMSRATYMRTLARQRAFVAMALCRVGRRDLSRPWWETASTTYTQAALLGGDVDADSPEAGLCGVESQRS